MPLASRVGLTYVLAMPRQFDAGRLRMTEPRLALLPDRGVVTVTGSDAAKLLQGLLTTDLGQLEPATVQLAGLLTPHGKILFEVLVSSSGPGSYLLDTARRQTAGLVQRLQLYKLRASVEIGDASRDMTVAAAWGEPGIRGGALVCRDTRHAMLGSRIIAARATDRELGDFVAKAAGEAAYHAHRIALGVPEGGRDYDFGDAFPHEANFDVLGGVAFDKGCFVGQEVVARMQHKTVVRKRVVRVTGSAALAQDRPDVTAGGVAIGKLGSVAGRQGLALLRLDRAVEAVEKGEPIVAAGVPLTVDRDALDRYRASAADRSATP